MSIPRGHESEKTEDGDEVTFSLSMSLDDMAVSTELLEVHEGWMFFEDSDPEVMDEVSEDLGLRDCS